MMCDSGRFKGTVGWKELQRERLRQYVSAESAILRGQSYTLEGRSLTRADLSEVRSTIDALLAAGVTLDDDGYKPRRTMRAVFVE